MSTAHHRGFLFAVLIICIVHPAPAFATLTNVTVDDQGTDLTTGESISYEGPWNIQPGCAECSAKADGSQAHDGTWHDTKYNINNPAQVFLENVTFNFLGTAIYVFGMIYGDVGIDLVFYMDDVEAGRFAYPSTSAYDYKYNQTYFQAEGLENASHSWKMQNGRWMEPQSSVVLFDYLIYTRDDGIDEAPVPPAPSSSTSAPSSSSSIAQPLASPINSPSSLAPLSGAAQSPNA